MKLLKTEEVGKILSFSPKKIRKMIADRELPALKIGGEFRIRQEDLQNYVEGLSVV
ncbi:MAG: helix-turn-helix domain-containing protein [Methanomicrobiales archaeon]|nr:helix-turn-helix domain-containing protein [Methanomicrobiales archaeon]